MRRLMAILGICIVTLPLFSQQASTKNSFLETWPGYAIAYSGYRNGQSPKKEIYPSKAEVLQDLQLLAPHWACIRTYGADRHTEDVLELIREHNLDLKVLLGIWLGGEPKYKDDNLAQIKKGIQLANTYKDIVFAVNVGNETQIHWSDHKVSPKDLIAYIEQVKQQVHVPVTTADTWDYWTNLKQSAPVIESVDFIAAHIYPIWGGVDIDKGLQITIETYESLKKAIPNKPIVIAEAGWATLTRGKYHAPGAGSEAKQAIYFHQLMNWSKDNRIFLFWFEAFDEPWKGRGTEGHWGLFFENRKPKEILKSLSSSP